MTVMEAWAVTLSTSVMTSQEYSAVSFNWTSVTLSVPLSKIMYLHTDGEAHVYNPDPEMLMLTLMEQHGDVRTDERAKVGGASCISLA